MSDEALPREVGSVRGQTPRCNGAASVASEPTDWSREMMAGAVANRLHRSALEPVRQSGIVPRSTSKKVSIS